MLARIFGYVQEKYQAHKAFGAGMDGLKSAVATEDAATVGALYTVVSSSSRFERHHADEILHAAMKRDDAAVLYAVLPKGDRNHVLGGENQSLLQTFDPLVNFALTHSRNNIARALIADPATDLTLRGSMSIYAGAGTPQTIEGVTPAEIVQRQGSDPALATALMKRLSAAKAAPGVKP